MALVLRLRDGDIVHCTLEDDRIVQACVKICSRNRVIAYVEAPKSIGVEHIRSTKKDSENNQLRTIENSVISVQVHE